MAGEPGVNQMEGAKGNRGSQFGQEVPSQQVEEGRLETLEKST